MYPMERLQRNSRRGGEPNLFIHVGGDIILRTKDIIAILNQDIREQASVTTQFLKAEERRKKKTVISADYIKSIIVTNHEIFYSPVSTLTLNKRALGKAMIDQSLDREEEVE